MSNLERPLKSLSELQLQYLLKPASGIQVSYRKEMASLKKSLISIATSENPKTKMKPSDKVEFLEYLVDVERIDRADENFFKKSKSKGFTYRVEFDYTFTIDYDKKRDKDSKTIFNVNKTITAHFNKLLVSKNNNETMQQFGERIKREFNKVLIVNSVAGTMMFWHILESGMRGITSVDLINITNFNIKPVKQLTYDNYLNEKRGFSQVSATYENGNYVYKNFAEQDMVVGGTTLETNGTQATLNIIKNPKQINNVDGLMMYGEELVKTGYEFVNVGGDGKLCVADALIAKYSKTIGLIKVMKNYDTLAKAFKFSGAEEMIESGISCEMLSKFCATYKINMYAIDSSEQKIKHYSSDAHGCSIPPLVFMMQNQHMCIIDSKSEKYISIIKSMSNKTHFSNASENFEKKGAFDYELVFLGDNETESTTTYDAVLAGEYNKTYMLKDLYGFAIYCIVTKKNVPNIIMNAGDVIQCSFNKFENKSKLVKYVRLEQSGIYADISKKYKFNYKGGKEAEIVGNMFKSSWDRINSDISTKDLREVFYNYNHNELFYKLKEVSDEEVLMGYDLKEAYAHGLSDNTEDWCCFDGRSQIVECNNLEMGEGMYYIELDGCPNDMLKMTLFFRRTKGWFYRHTVKYLLENFKTITIKYYLNPTKKIEKGFFKSIMAEIDEMCNGVESITDDNVAKELQKDTKRILSGLIRRYKSRVDSSVFIGTKAECHIRAKGIAEGGGKTFVECLKPASKDELRYDNGIYIAFKSANIERLSNSVPIGHQMLENTCVTLMNLYKGLNIPLRDVVAIKTDEIVVTGEVFKTIKQTIDNKILYKIKVNTKQVGCIDMVQINNEKSFIYSPLKINKISLVGGKSPIDGVLDITKSQTILAFGGTGKSTLLNKIDDPAFLRICHYNLAARNIGGQTISKATHRDIATKKYNLSIFKGKKGVIVDEISQIPYEIWSILLHAKHEYPNLIWILSGDFTQCGAIEDFQTDYVNCKFIYELVDGNVLPLTKCLRSDATTFNLCQDIINDRENVSKYILPENKKIEDCVVNIVRTNYKRKFINKKINEHLATDSGAIHLKAIVCTCKQPKCKCDSSQDVLVYENLPVIAFKSEKFEGVQVLNCERYNVDTFNCTHVTLKSMADINGHTNNLTITHKDFMRTFVLCYACTIDRFQGMTIDEPYIIHEWDKMDWRRKNTAIGRSTKEEYIGIKRD